MHKTKKMINYLQ